MEFSITISIDQEIIEGIQKQMYEKGKVYVPIQYINEEINQFISSLKLEKELSRIIANGGKIHLGKDLSRHIIKRMLGPKKYHLITSSKNEIS